MRPTEKGQSVRFHSPLEDENPNEVYEVLEIVLDGDRPRATIRSLTYTNLSFIPINVVKLEDLIIA